MRLFAELHARDPECIDAALRSDHMRESREIAHKLRGAAGALGLDEIARLAGALQDEARPGSECLALAAELRQAFDRAVEAIDARTSADEPPPRPTSDERDARAATARLLAALDSDDPKLIEPLLPLLSSIVPASVAQQVMTRVSAFDFRGAEAILIAGSEVRHG